MRRDIIPVSSRPDLVIHRPYSKVILFVSPIVEVRTEAVQQALAALKSRPKPSLPMPSKRSSVLNRSPGCNDELDSSTDDESIPEELISPDKEYNYPRDHISNSMLPPEPIIKPPIRESSMASQQQQQQQQHLRHEVKQSQAAIQKYPSSGSSSRPPQNLPPLVSSARERESQVQWRQTRRES